MKALTLDHLKLTRKYFFLQAILFFIKTVMINKMSVNE